MLELQWGHDEGVVEGVPGRAELSRKNRRFNGATTKVSWKARAAVYIGTAAQHRFNGATTKVSWKARCHLCKEYEDR